MADRVICAYAEPASGPGWANRPVWVIVQETTGRLRQECLQPSEQTERIRVLYAISAQVHGQMAREAESALRRAKRLRRG